MQDHRRGTVLVLSCLLVALVAVYGSAIMVRGLTEQRAAQRAVRLAWAFEAAEAGLDQAITQLRANANWSGATYTTTLQGGYDVTITNLSSTVKRLTVTGHYPSNITTTYGYQKRRVEGTLQVSPQSIFQYPLFGKDSVDLKKAALTDSYNSDQGSYDPHHPGQQGDVATNSTASNSVTLKKGTTVNGQVIVGPGMADPSPAVDQDEDAVITATPAIVSASQTLTLSAIDTTGMSCTTDLDLPKNGTFTFYESNSPYCYNHINSDKDSVITVSGNVKVYASQVNFDKNLNVNAGGRPTQFILSIYGTQDVTIDKDGTFVGGLYAPNAKVRLKKQVGFYGALAAKNVTVDKESAFHYDEALKNVSGPTTGNSNVQLLSWREL